MTERNVVYVTKLKKNLVYEILADCMDMNADGKMEDREQVAVFRKDGINHIARIITYVDIKNGRTPKLISLLTNGILKTEWLYRMDIPDGKKCKAELQRIIGFYNDERPHMSVGYQTPSEAHSQSRLQKRCWKNPWESPPD